jgi:hypothetical protein
MALHGFSPDNPAREDVTPAIQLPHQEARNSAAGGRARRVPLSRKAPVGGEF